MLAERPLLVMAFQRARAGRPLRPWQSFVHIAISLLVWQRERNPQMNVVLEQCEAVLTGKHTYTTVSSIVSQPGSQQRRGCTARRSKCMQGGPTGRGRSAVSHCFSVWGSPASATSPAAAAAAAAAAQHPPIAALRLAEPRLAAPRALVPWQLAPLWPGAPLFSRLAACQPPTGQCCEPLAQRRQGEATWGWGREGRRGGGGGGGRRRAWHRERVHASTSHPPTAAPHADAGATRPRGQPGLAAAACGCGGQRGVHTRGRAREEKETGGWNTKAIDKTASQIEVTGEHHSQTPRQLNGIAAGGVRRAAGSGERYDEVCAGCCRLTIACAPWPREDTRPPPPAAWPPLDPALPTPPSPRPASSHASRW